MYIHSEVHNPVDGFLSKCCGFPVDIPPMTHNHISLSAIGAI